MTRITLDEYAMADVALSPDQAATIQRAAGHTLSVTPAIAEGWYRLTATSFVGAVVAGDIEIRIRPKVSVDNVLFLLTAGAPGDLLRPDQVGYARSELTAAFAALYADVLTTALRRGPQHEYREATEDLDTIRGRIDITGQFRRPGLLVPVTCRFSEYSADTEANRYLKHVTRTLLRMPGVWRSTRRQLRHALASLDRVRDEPPPADLPLRMRFSRLNRHYETVLRLAHLVRRRMGMADVAGELSASSFLLDMNRIFERFVEHELRGYLRERLTVDGQWTDYLDLGGSVPIRPDLVFRDQRGRVVYVGDVKYKLSRDGLGRAGDYYQLHAYCTRFGLREGVLVYATDEGATPPRQVVTAGDGITLWTVRLPLHGTQSDIRNATARIAAHIGNRVTAKADVPVQPVSSA